MSTKKFIIDGKTFYSVREMCREYNITHSGFAYRRKQGHSILTSLKGPIKKKTGPTKRSKNENIESAIRKLKNYAKKKKIKTLKNWYKQPLHDVYNYVGKVDLKPFKGNKCISAIQLLYPDKKIYPWLFSMSPMGLWDKKENRIAYIKWLAKKLKFTKIKDWYNLNTRNDFNNNSGGGLLAVKKKDKDQSVLALLKEAYPSFNWKPWLFRTSPQGLWQDKKNHKLFLNWVFKKEKININNNSIYKLNATILRKYNGHMILREYDNFVECIVKNFPKAKINRLKFFHKGRGFWEDKQNHRIALLYLGEQLGFKKTKDWYAIQYDDFEKLGLSSLISQKGYNHSPEIVCQKNLPEHKFDSTRFDFSYKYEFRARCFARCLFGSNNIIKNAKLDYLRYKKSGRKMELDIFIPRPKLKNNWKLAIEYNGSQHYFPKFQTKKEFEHRKALDAEKIEQCPKYKIKLIIIKYSKWDGLPSSFIKILEKEIIISKQQKKLFWNRFKNDDLYADILKEKKKKL